MKAEQVLVIKAEHISPFIVKRGLITGCENEVLRLINEKHEFLPRPEAEDDPSYKQVIPYVAICRGDEVYLLRRLKKGGEARLHGLASIGVGGHINPADDDSDDVLMCGLRREVEEEVALESFGELRLVGLINDDTNEVGSVHLGFFFTLETSGDVSVRETEKLSGSWIKKSELASLGDELETWTQIAAQAL